MPSSRRRLLEEGDNASALSKSDGKKFIKPLSLFILLLLPLVMVLTGHNRSKESRSMVEQRSVPVSRGVSEGVSEKSVEALLGAGPSYPWTNTMLAWQRTAYHFQPEKNWMNDPDGPLFYKGWYHLFHQWNPDSALWGNITWGHAVSRDLIHWLYLPLAMVPDHWFDINGVWTGSATLLPNGSIVMIYTGDTDEKVQVQNVAFPADPSDPLLLNWVKYEGNPVLYPPKGIGLTDFRDPTTAWYVASDSSWRITIGSKVNKTGISLVYKTKDFLSYELLDGVLHAVPGTGMWECVDFYPVATEGTMGLDTSANGAGVKHVLKTSLDDDKHDYYAIGTYDAEKDVWTPDNPVEDVGIGLRVDYGKYYASKTFYDLSLPMASISNIYSPSSTFKHEKFGTRSSTHIRFNLSSRFLRLQPPRSIARDIPTNGSTSEPLHPLENKKNKGSLEKDPVALWRRYVQWLYQHKELGLFLDVSRIGFTDEFLDRMEPKLQKAFKAMEELDRGAIANPDEGRMVGHYWLRNAKLAPNSFLRLQIENTLDAVCKFADDVIGGKIKPPSSPTGRFTHVLSVGIGGSALGPQFVAEALAPDNPPLKIRFIDNTDPAGIDHQIAQLGDELASTLVIVISKSGGTPETRNGLLEVQKAFREAGLDFSKQGVAITQENSLLDNTARIEGWLARFPMFDWVGGRTSEMSAVGLLAAALQGIDVKEMLAGASLMDDANRTTVVKNNPAALLALCWYWASDGVGSKDMVVLPYKDSLLLFSRYLQQLVMESLGKEFDLDGNRERTIIYNKKSQQGQKMKQGTDHLVG